MKCICQWSQRFGILLDTVQRVSNEEAQAKVNTGDYAYVPKNVWKEAGRGN
jgi:hypothetical protein